jgi:hypothetical protein
LLAGPNIIPWRCTAFLIKLPAAHEPPRNIGGLQRRTLGRRMGGKIAGDRDQNVPALGRVSLIPAYEPR